jgi:hypothetical protein
MRSAKVYTIKVNKYPIAYRFEGYVDGRPRMNLFYITDEELFKKHYLPNYAAPITKLGHTAELETYDQHACWRNRPIFGTCMKLVPKYTDTLLNELIRNYKNFMSGFYRVKYTHRYYGEYCFDDPQELSKWNEEDFETARLNVSQVEENDQQRLKKIKALLEKHNLAYNKFEGRIREFIDYYDVNEPIPYSAKYLTDLCHPNDAEGFQKELEDILQFVDGEIQLWERRLKTNIINTMYMLHDAVDIADDAEQGVILQIEGVPVNVQDNSDLYYRLKHYRNFWKSFY